MITFLEPVGVAEVEASADVEADVAVEVLSPLQGPVLRSARLAALHETPQCFTADLMEESRRDDGYWDRALLDSTWFVARTGNRVIGLARVIQDPENDSSRYIESVWVEGPYRRRGILRRLLRTIEDLERLRGVVRLRLWVLEDNEDAQAAYRRLRFAFGKDKCDRQELVKAPGRLELRMNKPL